MKILQLIAQFITMPERFLRKPKHPFIDFVDKTGRGLSAFNQNSKIAETYLVTLHRKKLKRHKTARTLLLTALVLIVLFALIYGLSTESAAMGDNTFL